MAMLQVECSDCLSTHSLRGWVEKEDLIIKNDISSFYVGNNGKFDKMVQRILCELSAYHNITYIIVLSSFNEAIAKELASHTILPEGIEKIPPRFSICWRNEWMINHSDIVVTYVTHPSSGAAKYKQIAERKNKTVISLV